MSGLGLEQPCALGQNGARAVPDGKQLEVAGAEVVGRRHRGGEGAGRVGQTWRWAEVAAVTPTLTLSPG